jgi:hypothetical protein
VSGYVTLDSGDREEFATGSVRDVREGKGRYDLIPPHPLERLAGVYERGAAKYGDRNWELGQPVSRFLDSAIRHSFRHLEGHRDEDHLAQAAWNLFAAMHVEEMARRGLLPAELNDLVRISLDARRCRPRAGLECSQTASRRPERGRLLGCVPVAALWVSRDVRRG